MKSPGDSGVVDEVIELLKASREKGLNEEQLALELCRCIFWPLLERERDYYQRLFDWPSTDEEVGKPN